MAFNKNLFAFSLFLFVLPGCNHKKTHLIPHLRPLASYIDYQETQNGITLLAKKLTDHDCRPLFGDRARLLFKKRHKKQPIFPIQFSITNKTDHRIALKPEDIELELTNYKTVANRIEHNAFLHALGGCALALVITGGLVAGSALALTSGGILTLLFGNAIATVSAPLLVAGLSACIVTPFFLVIGTPIISTAKGVETSKENFMMRHELTNKSFKRSLLIDSGQTVDTLIFVDKRHYKSSFTVSFKSKNQEPITFHVTLHEND